MFVDNVGCVRGLIVWEVLKHKVGFAKPNLRKFRLRATTSYFRLSLTFA